MLASWLLDFFLVVCGFQVLDFCFSLERTLVLLVLERILLEGFWQGLSSAAAKVSRFSWWSATRFVIYFAFCWSLGSLSILVHYILLELRLICVAFC